MANEMLTVTDPFGRLIFLEQGLSHCEREDSPDIYDDVATVIEKPALMVQQKDDAEVLHYFRSVGWHKTMLIEVGFRNGRWETMLCTKNPSTDILSHVLRNGNQLI